VKPRLESLSLVAGLAWWLAMYPGLFGEDSLITLGEVRSGNITVWFTVWWGYIVKAITFNTRAIPLITLAGVLLLTWSVSLWMRAVFPEGRAREWTTLLICASPVVGAMGLQLRHDAWMTAGLLLVMAMMARLEQRGDLFNTAHGLALVPAVPLLATRHNGWPLLFAGAIAVLVFSGKRDRRLAAALLLAAAATFGIGVAAARVAGHRQTSDPVQVVEWVIDDVSCLLTKEGVEPTAEEWATLEKMASRRDWPQPVACRFVSPIFIAPSLRTSHIQAPSYGGLPAAWWSLARRYPAKMFAAHFGKLTFFLPPFATGRHEQTPFIHSTILPNDFGLAWAFPPVAELARLPVRAWNALRIVLANATVWLAVLWLAVRRRDDLSRALRPALMFGIILEAMMLVMAPASEGRYVLPVLITGQATLVFLLFERWTAPAASPRGVEKGLEKAA
jgi:hypothetical protein